MKKRIFETVVVGIFSVLFAAAAFWNRSLLEKQDPGQILSAETCGTDACSGEETADRRMDQEALTYEELFGTFLTEAGEGDDGNPVFDAGSRIGARIIARRVTWEEVRARELCDMENEGDYLLFEDLDSGKRFYVPDRYGEISDIQVTESGICIRSRQTASGFNRKEQEWYGKLQEHRIPGCFVFPLEGVIPICGGFGGYSHTF